AHETKAIGPAPERGSPEQRASWHAAYVALRMPDEARAVAAATAGELWARRAAYERETKWAPPYVARELREAHLAEDSYRADAELRRRHPDVALPPLHPDADAEPDRAEPDESRRSEADAESAADQGTAVRDDLSAALAAARQAQRIIAGRERQTDREARVAGD